MLNSIKVFLVIASILAVGCESEMAYQRNTTDNAEVADASVGGFPNLHFTRIYLAQESTSSIPFGKIYDVTQRGSACQLEGDDSGRSLLIRSRGDSKIKGDIVNNTYVSDIFPNLDMEPIEVDFDLAPKICPSVELIAEVDDEDKFRLKKLKDLGLREVCLSKQSPLDMWDIGYLGSLRSRLGFPVHSVWYSSNEGNAKLFLHNEGGFLDTVSIVGVSREFFSQAESFQEVTCN